MNVPELADHFWLSSSLKMSFDNEINVFAVYHRNFDFESYTEKL